MAVGSNITYKGHGLARLLKKKWAPTMFGAGTRQGKPSIGQRGFFGRGLRGRICTTVDGTLPVTDAAAELPLSLGDLCVHITNAGVLTDVYMATGGDPNSGTCTWTKIVA